MKKIYSIIFLLMFITSVVNAADRYSVASNIWNNINTWSATSGGASGATIPGVNDNVFIEGGFKVTISTNVSCTNLTVGTGTSGTLTFGNNSSPRTLTVSGNVSIASTGTINVADNNAAHVFNIAGNLSNAGSFDMTLDATSLCRVTFNGTANQLVSGAGATTGFDVITINNSGAVNNNIVEFTTSAFVNTGLVLTDGIFKFSTPNTLTSGNLNLGAAVGIIFNHAGAVLNNIRSYIVNGGTFELADGTWSNGNGNDGFTISGGTATFSGGALNVGGSFQMTGGTTTISGSTISIDPNGSSQLGSTSHIFEAQGAAALTFSSGTVTIVDPHDGTGSGNAVQLDSGAGAKNLSGGTISLGNGSSTTTGTTDGFDINAGVALGHLIINNPSGTNRHARLVTNNCSLSGDLSITAGTLQSNTFDLSVGGNWSNSGTFTQGTDLVTFNGSSAQTISGSTVTTFYQLTINNTSGGVSLSQDVNGTNLMTFTSGVVTSSSANILTINDNATVSGASNASYVDGPMTKLGNNDFTFPVGDPLGSYHRLRVDNSGGANDDSYTVEYFRASALIRGPVSTGIFGVSNCEHWEVLQNATGGNNPDISVSWTADSPCGGLYVTQLLGLTPVWFNGTHWVIPSGTGTDNTGNTTDGESQRDGASQFGYWALGNVAANGSPLPVKIGSIKAYEKMNGIQLDWIAFTEFNVEKYIIERSPNGAQFTAIGDVVAMNSPNATSYGFFDASPLPGISYYRLRNLDIDGKSGYSNIVRVDLRKDNKEIILYPNPARSGGIISYSSANLARGNYSARIFNAAGQQLLVQQFSHNGGAINQTIQLPASARSGYYTLQLEYEGTRLAGKTFMVQ